MRQPTTRPARLRAASGQVIGVPLVVSFGVTYDVPFILGELPQGGCCASHNTLVHQAAEKLPKGSWVSQDGTKVMDEYHFDHASVITMGKRFGEKMISELGW